jgi:hypothetical protein
MKILAGLVLLAAICVAPPALAVPKSDIRGIAIGMTPEQAHAVLTDCKQQDPADTWRSAKDPAGNWIGQSVMTCRIAGEPTSTLGITFASSLSGKTACRVEYRFESTRSSDALVADVMAQFGLPKPWDEDAVHVWKLSAEVTLVLAAHTQQKTLSLRNDGLCDRDTQAIADYRKAQQNAAPAPSF